MNCPQCQTANGPGSAFCGNCGAQMAAAPAAAPAGYPPPQGAGTPLGYAASGAPAGHDAPQGYDAQGGYNPAAPQQSAGYPPPQGQYQPPQGQYQPPAGGPQMQRSPSLPPVSFDLNRLTSVDKIVAGGSLVALISVFLPWYAVSAGAFGSYSFSGTSLGHGWFWLEFVVALALIAYLAMRAAWERPPVTLPVAHAPLLIVGTSLQLLLVLINFVFIPYGNEGDGWDWGAFIGLLAALAAAGPVVVPAVRSYLASRNGASGPRSY